MEVFVEADELDLVPADADSEPEAAARQLVERGRLLCDQDSLPLRQSQPANRKADPLRAAGQKAEQYEGIVIGVYSGADAATLVIAAGIDPEHVIGVN